MADFTAEDRAKAAQAVAGLMSASDAHVLPATMMTTAALNVDPKKLFCENWETVKTVLQALASLVPGAGLIVGWIIKAGDLAHGAICPG